MVEAALKGLSEREIVHLDDERKAAMVSNLLVVLCSDRRHAAGGERRHAVQRPTGHRRRPLVMGGPGKKAFALRIDPALWLRSKRLAAQELRSANAQVGTCCVKRWHAQAPAG